MNQDVQCYPKNSHSEKAIYKSLIWSQNHADMEITELALRSKQEEKTQKEKKKKIDR